MSNHLKIKRDLEDMIGWIWKIVSSDGKFPAKLLLMKLLLFIKKSKGVLAYENLNGVSDNQ